MKIMTLDSAVVLTAKKAVKEKKTVKFEVASYMRDAGRKVLENTVSLFHSHLKRPQDRPRTRLMSKLCLQDRPRTRLIAKFKSQDRPRTGLVVKSQHQDGPRTRLINSRS